MPRGKPKDKFPEEYQDNETKDEDYQPDTDNAAVEGEDKMDTEPDKAPEKESEYEEVRIINGPVWHRDGVAQTGETVNMWKPHAEIARERNQVK